MLPADHTIDLYHIGASEKKRTYSIVSDYTIKLQVYQACNIHNHSGNERRVVLYI